MLVKRPPLQVHGGRGKKALQNLLPRTTRKAKAAMSLKPSMPKNSSRDFFWKNRMTESGAHRKATAAMCRPTVAAAKRRSKNPLTRAIRKAQAALSIEPSMPKQRFYPQCQGCSHKQSGAVKSDTRTLLMHHGGLKAAHFAGTLLFPPPPPPLYGSL